MKNQIHMREVTDNLEGEGVSLSYPEADPGFQQEDGGL